MKKDIVSIVRAIALMFVVAMVAVTTEVNIAWAQPVVPQNVCDHWAEPLPVTLPIHGRMSVGRLVEILAEDLAPGQVGAQIIPADLTIPRLKTQHHPLHATSVDELVRGLYTGTDEAVRTALVRETTATVRRLGQNRVSIDEGWRYCQQVDPTTNQVQRIRATGAVCADGTLAIQTSRSRVLTGAFNGNFYTGSFAPDTERTRSADDYRGWFGYSLRVNIKASNAPLVFSVNRVYSSEAHPRAAARLCRVLPGFATANITSADGKREVFDTVAGLSVAAISEGDIATAAWAAEFAPTVYDRVAGLDALRGCEDHERALNTKLNDRYDEIVRVRANRDATALRLKHWQQATYGLIGFIAIASLTLAFLNHRRRRYLNELAKQTEEGIKEAKTQGRNNLWMSLEIPLTRLLNTVRGNLDRTETDSPSVQWLNSFDNVPNVAAATLNSPADFLASACIALVEGHSNIEKRERAAHPVRLTTPPTNSLPPGARLITPQLYDEACTARDTNRDNRATLLTALAKAGIINEALASPSADFDAVKSSILTQIHDASLDRQRYRDEIALAEGRLEVLRDQIRNFPNVEAVKNAAYKHGRGDGETAGLEVASECISSLTTELDTLKQDYEKLKGRFEKVESDEVLLRSCMSMLWYEIMRSMPPEDHVPTRQECTELLRHLRASKVATAPHAAITPDDQDEAPSPDVVLVTTYNQGQVEGAQREFSRAKTQQFEAPPVLRRAANRVHYMTAMVPAVVAIDPNQVHSKITVALPAAQAISPSTDDAIPTDTSEATISKGVPTVSMRAPARPRQRTDAYQARGERSGVRPAAADTNVYEALAPHTPTLVPLDPADSLRPSYPAGFVRSPLSPLFAGTPPSGIIPLHIVEDGRQTG